MATHKCSGTKGGIPGPEMVKGPVSESDPFGSYRELSGTVVAYINKQGGTHLAEICALLWRIMTWYHHYKITLRNRHIPLCLM